MVEGTFVESKIEDARAFGSSSGTYTINLPTAQYLSSLLLYVKNTNGATSNTGQTIEDCITKIEVIGDGVTLFSASGKLARKFAHFDAGDEISAKETQEGSAIQYAAFPVSFGRDQNDKELLIPAWSLSTLQMKITYSFTDNATTGWASSSSNAQFDCIARYLFSPDRVNTPFLKKTEIYSKTPSNTGTEEVVLPVGAGNGSYRRIMLYCYEAGIEDGVDITDFQLRVNDSQTLREDKFLTAQVRNALKYNAKHTKNVTLIKANGETYDSKVSNIKSALVSAGVNSHIVSLTAIAGDRVTTGLYTDAGVAITNAEAVRLSLVGSMVSHAVMIDLGTDNLSDSLYVGSGSNISSLKLKYTVGATGGDTRVLGEQLVQY